MKKIIPSLSKMWLKVINLEQSLFPKLEESMGVLSPKEEKLIKILDFAEIEKFVSSVQITNPPKDREEHPKGISSLRSGHGTCICSKTGL
jgi:hypothetical protein